MGQRIINLKTKIAEKKLQIASKKVDKWEKLFYERQYNLQRLYTQNRVLDIHDDASRIEADMAAFSAWEDGVVVKEEKQ